jgi:hypothetical protein
MMLCDKAVPGIRRLPSKLMIKTKRFDRLFIAFAWIRDLLQTAIAPATVSVASQDPGLDNHSGSWYRNDRLLKSLVFVMSFAHTNHLAGYL